MWRYWRAVPPDDGSQNLLVFFVDPGHAVLVEKSVCSAILGMSRCKVSWSLCFRPDILANCLADALVYQAHRVPVVR